MNNSNFPFLEALVLEGVYSAYWVVWPMAIDRVRSMLPPGLKLGKQNLTLPSTHPVLFGFGQHQHATLSEFKFLFNDVTYLESSISVPFVQFEAINKLDYSEKNFLYIPQLNLDNPLAVLGGDLFWGFTKKLGNLNPGNQFFPTYEVNDYPFNNPLVSLNFEITGNYQKPENFPNFAAVKTIMNQPLVLKMFMGFGPYVSANYIWNFDEALMRPIEAEVNIFQQYVPGLQAGSQYNVGGIDKVELGAFQMINPWVLQLPSLVN